MFSGSGHDGLVSKGNETTPVAQCDRSSGVKQNTERRRNHSEIKAYRPDDEFLKKREHEDSRGLEVMMIRVRNS